MKGLISSHIGAYYTKRERTSTRNADGTRKRGHGVGPHSNGNQAKALCPCCGRPMLVCMGNCICDDAEAEADYRTRNNSGKFTLDSSGHPVGASGLKRGQHRKKP